MKFAINLTIATFFSVALFAQEKAPENKGYQFTTIKEYPVTSVKNQSRSSTCWSFSMLSFMESELIRTGKGEHDLSEMFIVANAYYDKADKYIRTNGNINFSPGSSFGDALTVWRNWGMVPDEVLPGFNYGESIHVHNEFDAVTAGYISALDKNPNKKLSTAWKAGFRGILDAYLGKIPEKFTYRGKEYTPKSFADELGLNIDDYVSITSFNHHPFYTTFAIEIPDNWRWDRSYNLPLDEFISVFDYALENGHTVLWGTDVSENGFTRKGIAIVAETETENMSGSDQAKWIGVTKQQLESKLNSLEEILPEKVIDQNIRQIAFDNRQTTDDHGMHIFGLAKDQNGNKYYMVKNSWGPSAGYKGVWYASEAFVKYKTINIVVHKNAVPKEIRKKLGF
ncbi:MAG: C1 family peptidase [Bacteroidales bacterium]|nr:C1 family peptidase [Bacteroidales bacterium]